MKILTDRGKEFGTPEDYQAYTVQRVTEKCPDAKIYTAKNPKGESKD